jgi:signal transduction histidine kinase
MKKVLVIEDSPDVLALILETLSYEGYATLAAEDGLRGIDLAQRERPDLILCDVNMPHMNGYDTLDALRRDSSTAYIPFIFLTAVADRQNVRKGMELGADDYLSKPFTIEELLAAVNTRLEKHQAVEQLTEQRLEELRVNIQMALPHEFRTPLNGIMGLSSLLQETSGTMKPEEIRENARYIYDSALRLHRLVENFLIYTQLELIAADFNKQAAFHNTPPMEVSALIAESAQQLAEKRGRSADLILRIPEVNLQITRENCEKIIQELVDNALKFSPAGSPLEITGQKTPNGYFLSVTDRGRGMTPEEIKRIGAYMQFGRQFYEQQGAGLGLTIAKRLAELHGGTLSLESDPEVRTTVTVWFPIPAGEGG